MTRLVALSAGVGEPS
ncbi:hypothetical protein, partial [Aeromicrobium flavum]